MGSFSIWHWLIVLAIQTAADKTTIDVEAKQKS
jgi:hypothetical protein